MSTSQEYQTRRERMVSRQLAARGIKDMRVLDAMRRVPRHLFVPPAYRHLAYQDRPLPILEQQTISQPYIVAYMTQALALQGHERVLEIGTGSGYQTAVLCELASYVYSVEVYARLADRAGKTLEKLHYSNIEIHVGDGSQGLADMAPFDAIIVTAAAPALPGPLRTQLNPEGGRMVLPVGDQNNQHLELIIRDGDTWELRELCAVRFVPLRGRYGFDLPLYPSSRRDST